MMIIKKKVISIVCNYLEIILDPMLNSKGTNCSLQFLPSIKMLI